jgi:hypothetical protein
MRSEVLGSITRKKISSNFFLRSASSHVNMALNVCRHGRQHFDLNIFERLLQELNDFEFASAPLSPLSHDATLTSEVVCSRLLALG